MTEPTARGASGRAATQRVVAARDNVTAGIGLVIAFLGTSGSTGTSVLGGLGAVLGVVALVLALLGLEDDPRVALSCVGTGALVAGWGLFLS